MKNKKNIYILVPAVLMVWGIIGYRIFKSMGSSKSTKQVITMVEKFKPKDITEKEIYKIKADYRDPFLTYIPIRKKRKKIKPLVAKVKEKIVFPTIVYKGIFSSSNKSNTIFLITVNGSQQMFKINEIIQEVKLLKGDKEKITLKYKTEKETFYLQ